MDHTLKQLLEKPELFFHSPHEAIRLIKTSELNKDKKIKMLENWEYDVLDRMVAEEENMNPLVKENYGSLLASIRNCLRQLRGEEVERSTAPTKQGGL